MNLTRNRSFPVPADVAYVFRKISSTFDSVSNIRLLYNLKFKFHIFFYSTYIGWIQTEYQNKRYNIKQKDEGKLEDREKNGRTNFNLRIKEQETRLILHEHDDYDDDDASYK
jgi:hypothetical protein